MRRSTGVEAMLTVVAVALIALFTALNANRGSKQTSQPSTFDTGALGLAALFDLLHGERVHAVRFESPLFELSNVHGTFVVAGDAAVQLTLFDRQSQRALDAWVKNGGRLLLLGEQPSFTRALGLPKPYVAAASQADVSCLNPARRMRVSAPFTQAVHASCRGGVRAILSSKHNVFGVALRHGRGTIVWIASAAPFQNSRIADGDNAAFAYALFANAGDVAFDERIYGYANDRTMWQVLPVPVRTAAIIAALALLLALIGANLPFAPPIDLRERLVPNTFAYIDALAALLQRGGTDREVIRRYCTAVEALVGARRGAGVGARDAQALRDEAAALLQSSDRDDVLRAAQLYARARKEFHGNDFAK